MLNPKQINRLLDLVRSKIPADELEQFCAQNGIGLDIKKVDLSIVIPVYNEEDNIQPLIERLVKTVADITDSYEIIFIDDGSKDRTVNRILEMQKKFPGIVLLKLSRNFGQHNAAQAGFDHSCGDAIILLDADLQETPEEIFKLWEKYKEGYDIVYTMREFAPGSRSLLKKISSKVFKKIFNRLIANPLPNNVSAMRIMSRRYLQHIMQLPERVRFLDGIFSWVGFKSSAISIKYSPRHSGESNYNSIKRLKMSIDAIFSFSIIPLRFITGFGVVISFMSFLYMLYILVGRSLGLIKLPLGWSSIMVSIYFLGGIQCIFIGLLGEYLGKIFLEVKSRPLYIIEDYYKL